MKIQIEDGIVELKRLSFKQIADMSENPEDLNNPKVIYELVTSLAVNEASAKLLEEASLQDFTKIFANLTDSLDAAVKETSGE